MVAVATVEESCFAGAFQEIAKALELVAAVLLLVAEGPYAESVVLQLVALDSESY